METLSLTAELHCFCTASSLATHFAEQATEQATCSISIEGTFLQARSCQLTYRRVCLHHTTHHHHTSPLPRLHEEVLRAQGVLPSSTTAQGLDRYRQEAAPVPQYIRAVGAPLPKAAGTGVHSAVQREIENLLAGRCMACCLFGGRAGVG